MFVDTDTDVDVDEDTGERLMKAVAAEAINSCRRTIVVVVVISVDRRIQQRLVARAMFSILLVESSIVCFYSTLLFLW